MRAPLHRAQFVGLVEADSASSAAVAFSEAMLGNSAHERLRLVACMLLPSEADDVWPCLGDESAARSYEQAQRAVVAVDLFHGEGIKGYRPLTGLAYASADGISSRLNQLNAEVLVAARCAVLNGSLLATVIGRAQLPSCVVAGGFAGSIRKVAVAVDLQEGGGLLVERALVLASQLGVALVPVHVARVAGAERPAPNGSELKRFEQMMSQVELSFGAAYTTRNLLQPLEVVGGEVAESLASWATDAGVDLVVVGSGAPSRSTLSLGSVTTSLVSSFPVSLWVEQLGNRAEV